METHDLTPSGEVPAPDYPDQHFGKAANFAGAIVLGDPPSRWRYFVPVGLVILVLMAFINAIAAGEAVAERAECFLFPLVVDPVMVSKHGAPLIDDAAVEVLRGKLLPHAFLVTPNVPEAARLAGMEVTDRRWRRPQHVSRSWGRRMCS